MKTKKNNFRGLILAVFLHLFSLVCSVYGDIVRKGSTGYKEVNYGLVFFSGGCVQASLITIIYFIYKLCKKSPSNYFDKIFDLVVINANIITIAIFTISAITGMTPTAQSSELIPIFSWEVSFWKFGGFYATIWHYLAPILAITYFVKRKASLAQTYFERRQLFLYSFFHPFIYFIFVLIRPSLPGATKYHFSGDSQYPYFFFDWIMGNDFRHIIGGLVVILIIFFWLVIFWLSTLFFGWYANHKLKNGNSLEKKQTLAKVSQCKQSKNSEY